MKRIVVKRPRPEHKILEGQSQKLKHKLDNLKKQIDAKKKQKQGQKGRASTQLSCLSKSRRSNTSQMEVQGDLAEVLARLNIDKISKKLQEKGITTIEEFINIKQQQLDNWRDIAVGYRIKIRKYLDGQHSKLQSIQPSINHSPEKPQFKKRNIEDIMKIRKEEQVYVPINRAFQLGGEEGDEELGEEEQQIMINSLMRAFKGVGSQVLKVSQCIQSQVWGQEEDSIEEIKYQQPRLSVKNIGSQKQLMLERQTFPDYKYCWVCIRKLQGDSLTHNKRQFCSQSCLQQHKSTLANQSNNFYNQISQVQQQFKQHIQSRKAKVYQQPKPLPQPEAFQLDLEIV